MNRMVVNKPYFLFDILTHMMKHLKIEPQRQQLVRKCSFFYVQCRYSSLSDAFNVNNALTGHCLWNFKKKSKTGMSRIFYVGNKRRVQRACYVERDNTKRLHSLFMKMPLINCHTDDTKEQNRLLHE